MASLIDLYRQNVPAYKRLYAESIGKSLLGMTDKPITEADFTPEELQDFSELMQFHKQIPANKIGSRHTISDYDEYNRFLDYKNPQSDEEALKYTTDLPQRLGRFMFADTPEGYTISDTYEFRNENRKPQASLMDMLKDAATRYQKKGLHGAAGALGEYLLYDRGIPVNIKVPAK